MAAPHFELQTAMDDVHWNEHALASEFRVAVRTVNRWRAGSAPVPAWVLPALRLVRQAINQAIG